MRNHLLVSVPATLSILLLQAFAQSGNADTSLVGTHAPPIPPCSLFTASDAQRIVGVPMKMGTPPGGAEFASLGCSYEPAKPIAGPQILVDIIVFDRKSRDGEDETWNMQKSVLASGDKANTESVAGVGDDAFAVHVKMSGGVSTSLFVRKGTCDFEMQSNGTKSEPLPVMKEIAKKIADRL